MLFGSTIEKTTGFFTLSSLCVFIILSLEGRRSLLGGVARMSFFTIIFRLKDIGHVSLKNFPYRGLKIKYCTWSVPTVLSSEKEENDIG